MHIEQLTKLGLNSGEAKIYAHLLRHGDAPASEIAQTTGLGRTNVYEYAKSLIRKGLLKEYQRQHKLYYQAGEPQKLRALLASKLLDLKQLQATGDEFINQLEVAYKSDLPKFRHLLGENGLTILHDLITERIETSSTLLFLIADLDDYVDVFNNKLRNLLLSKKIQTVLVLNSSEKLADLQRRDGKENRKTIMMPLSRLKINKSLLIFGNLIASGSFKRKSLDLVSQENLELAQIVSQLADIS